jgi:hypothetical protein
LSFDQAGEVGAQPVHIDVHGDAVAPGDHHPRASGGYYPTASPRGGGNSKLKKPVKGTPMRSLIDEEMKEMAPT